MAFSKSLKTDELSATAAKFVANPAQVLESTTVDFDKLNAPVVTDANQFLENDIEEIQKLKKEISKLQTDARNLNTQILEAKNNENKKEENRLLQEKISIKNELKIKEQKLNKLLIPDDNFNKNTQLTNDLVDERVSEPTSILDLSSVSGLVNSSLQRGRINNLVSKLGVGALLATALTVGANPAQAGIFINETTINFDEVNVGLEAEDNPFLDDANKIDNLWADQGVKISSDRNELWLYDTSKRGRDNDLRTGEGKWGNVEYNSKEQGNVLIIQEYNQNDLRPDDNYNKNTRFKNDFADAEYQQNRNEYKGGSIKFDFTDKNAAGEEIGVLFNSIGLLDLDEHKLPEFMVKFAGGDELIKFKFNERDANKQSVGNRTEMLTLERSEYVTQMTRQRAYNTKKKKVTDENSLRTYDFDFGDKRVTEFYVNLSGSGAITDLNYYREDTPNFSRKVPEPTSILSLAAMSALAASSLKRKRKCQISN